MANTIQIRRGAKASLPTLDVARFGFTTDTHQLYIGEGTENILILLNRTTSIASSATPTPNCDTTDNYVITALAEAATFGAPTGTPIQGQKLIIRIKDNGTARALAWNAIYVARGQTLPATTILGKYLRVGLIYNSQASAWDCVATAQEA